MKKFFKKIWGIWFFTILITGFLVLYPFFKIFLSRPEWYHIGHKLRGYWGLFTLAVTGMIPKVKWESKPEKGKTYILTPNHTSYLDIICLCVILDHDFNFMGKKELQEVPLFGIFFKTIDIAVDRKSAIGAHRSFLQTAEQIDSGKSIVIFPEGTIGKHVPALGNFKNGSFKLAIDKKVELLPITFRNNYKRLPDDGSFTASPGFLKITVHRPIQTVDLNASDADKLKNEVFTIIERELAQNEN